MYIALVSVIIFACVLLILVILSQSSKGGGASQFGGGGATQLMGVKRTGDILEKMTWGLAIALMFFALISHTMLDAPETETEAKSINVERANTQEKVQLPQESPVGEAQEAVTPEAEMPQE